MKFNPIGERLTTEQLGNIEEAENKEPDELREVNFFEYEGEIKKAKEEVEFIDELNQCLLDEFKGLGINTSTSSLVSADRIHFLPPEKYYNRYGANGIGYYDINNGAILINSVATRLICPDSRNKLFQVIAHEVIHSLSYETDFRLGYSVQANDANKNKIMRSMYSNYDEHFRGLNEAVTDKMAIEVLNKILKKEPLPESMGGYSEFIDILNMIIEKVSQENNEGVNAIWKAFKRGLFSGEMMHLREIEKIFGRGALRILAALREWDERGGDFKETKASEVLYEKALKYFKTDNEQERNIIAKSILKKKFIEQKNK